MIRIPENIAAVITRLEAAGYQAFVVGGCVRDSLRGQPAKDWDVCTDARPEQTIAVFSGERVIETGIKHGTVTVVSQGENVEITTFRADGAYSDGRHPDSVEFRSRVEDDLARRDFTCNAIAYSPTRGLHDPFSGAEDIRNGVIRAVGDAVQRFNEDALRILRAMRFCSVLDFEIEADTSRAIHSCRKLLDNIAGERILVELEKMLCGENIGKVIREYHDVLDVFIPKFSRMAGFDQKSPYHYTDLLGHVIDVVRGVEPVYRLRLAALLHDIGKPECFTVETSGRGHTYGHEKHGADMLGPVWTRLKPDNFTRQRVTDLVHYHHLYTYEEAGKVKKQIARFGEGFLRDYIAIARADAAAHTQDARDRRFARLAAYEALLNEIISSGDCYMIKDMKINGGDIIAMGVQPGRKVGEVLRTLLDEVIDGKIENERSALLERARQITGGKNG